MIRNKPNSTDPDTDGAEADKRIHSAGSEQTLGCRRTEQVVRSFINLKINKILALVWRSV